VAAVRIQKLAVLSASPRVDDAGLDRSTDSNVEEAAPSGCWPTTPGLSRMPKRAMGTTTIQMTPAAASHPILQSERSITKLRPTGTSDMSTLVPVE
jgi:hypothetical protein